jgi:hypothetical protein
LWHGLNPCPSRTVSDPGGAAEIVPFPKTDGV